MAMLQETFPTMRALLLLMLKSRLEIESVPPINNNNITFCPKQVGGRLEMKPKRDEKQEDT
jgi:hypothetical protein